MDDRNSEASNTVTWKPISAIPRRILGVLVEKAKTTPDAYPLSLNALTTGCNQKSNRDPVMNLSGEEVEDALEELRTMGAVAEVHGDGRVIRYRHYMKDWLGVDGVELAIMTELLLRGTQTVGELRTRASRMAPNQLPDLSALEPVLKSLMDKKLVVAVTPAGRGQLVTHGLYLEAERNRILREHSSRSSDSPESSPHSTVGPTSPRPGHAQVVPQGNPGATTSARGEPAANAHTSADEITVLRQEIRVLRDELARVKQDVADLWSNLK